MKRHVGLALVGLLALGACGGSAEADSGALLACSDFRSAARDSNDGLLTDEELRGKLKDIESNASVSEEPGVASSARAMLAAATAGDVDGLAVAVERMADACDGIN